MDRYELVEEYAQTTRRCLSAKVRDIHEMVISFFKYRVEMGCTVMNEKDAEWMTKFAKTSKDLEELFDDRFGEVVDDVVEKD